MASTNVTLEQLRGGAKDAGSVAVRAGFGDTAGFALIQRAAQALGASTLVPDMYRGNIPDCIVALELAQRIGASPLMVMQNLYIVHGRPAWSAQFLIACVNQCGRFTALKYEWGGKQGADDWSCRAYATERATGERVQGPAVTLGMARREGWYDKKGSKWQTVPELMMMYRAGTFFARTNAPELTMGLQTADELGDTFDATKTDGAFAVPVGEPEAPPPAPASPPPSPARPRAHKKIADAESIPDDAPSYEAMLRDVDMAPNSEAAELVLDAARGLPFYSKLVEAFNARWAESIG